MIVTIIYWVFLIGVVVNMFIFFFFLGGEVWDDINFSLKNKITIIKNMRLKLIKNKHEVYTFMAMCSISWFFFAALGIGSAYMKRIKNRRWNCNFNHLSDNNQN